MSLPRFRFTIRWMMVAVAIVGLAMGIVQFRRIAAAHVMRAESHAQQEAVICERLATVSEEFLDDQYHLTSVTSGTTTSDRPNVFGFVTSGFPDGFRTLEGWRDLAKWHNALNQKYARSARYPWLPVAPDPPEPPE
jgi:hypothetical protein